MFTRVIRHSGFWKSVVFLSIMYLVILLLVQWFATGFSNQFVTILWESDKVWMLPFAGFIAGFMVSYGKFWARLKKEDKRR
ncbi:MAG: hypothetical protein K0U54_13215 [Bacteroidetes bacterium]|nr:hypothetical protein [Bacteroidota bacterium]